MKKSYVGKGKLKEPMYSTYFRTIGEILCAEYVQNDGDVNSYYSQLLAQMPGLSDDEYRTKHRTILEYLAKLTRRDFVERVRKELSK